MLAAIGIAVGGLLRDTLSEAKEVVARVGGANKASRPRGLARAAVASGSMKRLKEDIVEFDAVRSLVPNLVIEGLLIDKGEERNAVTEVGAVTFGHEGTVGLLIGGEPFGDLNEVLFAEKLLRESAGLREVEEPEGTRQEDDNGEDDPIRAMRVRRVRHGAILAGVPRGLGEAF